MCVYVYACIYAYIKFCRSSFARLVFMFSRERRLANKNSKDNKDEKITMSTKNIYKLWKQQSWKRFLPVFALWKGFFWKFLKREYQQRTFKVDVNHEIKQKQGVMETLSSSFFALNRFFWKFWCVHGLLWKTTLEELIQKKTLYIIICDIVFKANWH